MIGTKATRVLAGLAVVAGLGVVGSVLGDFTGAQGADGGDIADFTEIDDAAAVGDLTETDDTAAIAAPNPVRSNTAAHTVSIRADGSYRMTMEQTLDMARSYLMALGGTIHDGFRLPDTGSTIPGYLRPTYTDFESVVDGSPRDAEVVRTHHAVEMEIEETLDEGEHTATFRYGVAGAAVPEGEFGEMRDADAPRDVGVVVHVRPLRGGNVTVRAEGQIDAVECVTIPPHAKQCGEKNSDGWFVGQEEFGAAGELRVVIDSDPAELAEPVIDGGAAGAGSASAEPSGSDPTSADQ